MLSPGMLIALDVTLLYMIMTPLVFIWAVCGSLIPWVKKKKAI